MDDFTSACIDQHGAGFDGFSQKSMQPLGLQVQQHTYAILLAMRFPSALRLLASASFCFPALSLCFLFAFRRFPSAFI